MDRINRILTNEQYINTIHEIEKFEETRQYCKHNLVHFLDVSRIAYIKVLEKELPIAKDIVYAVGLLHDVGRSEQYRTGIPHRLATHNIISSILENSSFNQQEIQIIIDAIKNHDEEDLSNTFNAIIYQADKESRLCMNCAAIDTCKLYIKNVEVKF